MLYVLGLLLLFSNSPMICVGRTVGCAGFGLLEGVEDEMDQEGCEEFVRRMALPFLPRNGHSRDPRSDTLVVHDA